MIQEAIGVWFLWAVLALIGLGPVLWARPNPAQDLRQVLGLAPAVGLAIIGLLSYPLVRYVAPVRLWAWPLALTLIAFSVLLVVREWRHGRLVLRILPWREWVTPTCGLLASLWLLVVPILAQGIQYAVFRSNPSDAFYYMTLAESARVLDWQTWERGAPLQNDNEAALRTLTRASPTAIFNARLLERAPSLTTPVVLAWSAQLASTPIYRFYFAFHLLCLAVALPVVGTLARQFTAQWLAYLGAGAAVFGFWTRFVLETDSSQEISAIPIVLLFVWQWLSFEAQAPRTRSRALFALAVSGAAVVCFYIAAVPVLALGFGLYYALGLLQRLLPWQRLANPALTALLILLILLVTGQLDAVIKNVQYAASATDLQAGYPPEVFNLLRAEGLSAAAGLPRLLLFESLPEMARWPLRRLADLLGIWLPLALAASFGWSVRRRAAPGERILISVLAGGLCLAGLFVLRDNSRAAGKALTYVVPYFVLAAMLFSGNRNLAIIRPVRLGAQALLAMWLVSQILVGMYLPFARGLSGLFVQAERSKPENYDLAFIEAALAQTPPRLLLVYIPRTEDWPFAYYSIFVFGRYPAYFQSGLIVDNSTRYQNLWLAELDQAPDYAVVLKRADYIASQRLGVRIAETRDLVLYQVTVTQVGPFQAQERLFQAEESKKPTHPPWQAQTAP